MFFVGAVPGDFRMQSRHAAVLPVARIAVRPRFRTAWLLAALLVSPLSAFAQAPKPAPELKAVAKPVVTGEVEFAPLADWSHARAVYRLVEAWVLSASTEIKKDAAPIRVSGVAGVRVTLRRGGYTVGVGDAFIPELAAGPVARLIKSDDDLGPTCDLAALTRSATQQAMAAFGQELARVRSKQAEKYGQAAKSQGIAEIVPFLTVDIQVAKLPKPVFVAPNAEEGAIYQTFAPGFHGLRLVRTDQTDLMPQAWIWPATSLASNFTPRTQLLQLLTDLKFEDHKLAMLGRSDPLPQRAPTPKPATTRPADAKGGAPEIPIDKNRHEILPASLERFEVLHIARGNVQAPELLLTRGNILLPTNILDEQTLRELAERLASHLVRRIRSNGPLSGTMVGTYEPTSGGFEPAVASDEEIALTTLALSRWAQYMSRRDAGNPQQIKTDNAIVAAVNFARDRVIKGTPPAGPTVAAMVVRTLTTAPHLSNNKSKRDEMLNVILACRNPDGSFRESAAESAKKLSTASQALLTSAMAAVYAQNTDPKLGEQARQSLELLWLDLDLTKAITALPWIIDAEFDLQKVPIPAPPPGAQQITRAQAINTIVTVLRDRQVVAAPTLGPADVVGGFEFSRLPIDAPPNPDWRSAFALDFIARAMRYPKAVPAKDRLSWVLSCGLSARFLAQLSFDEPSCFYVRSQPDAIGGVRMALWDNRLAAAPSAVSLIAVCDLLESLAQIQESGGLEAPDR